MFVVMLLAHFHSCIVTIRSAPRQQLSGQRNLRRRAACPAALADWSDAGILAKELYNHSDSPVPQSYDVETVNIAGLPGSAAVEAQLHGLLHDFNTRGTR